MLLLLVTHQRSLPRRLLRSAFLVEKKEGWFNEVDHEKHCDPAVYYRYRCCGIASRS